MPTKATPEYKRDEATYKSAREPLDRLTALREMLQAIPKHKGTEHVQADIKKKIKDLNEELAGPKKGGTRSGPPTSIRAEGAGQIGLLGPANSGKSTLHHALTGSGAATGPYEFTTLYPQPGMLGVKDVGIQLIDLPPISANHPIPWIANALPSADGAMLVVDLAHAGCIAAVESFIAILAEKRVRLIGHWPREATEAVDADDPFAKLLPTMIVAARAHEIEDVEGELAVLEDLVQLDVPTLHASVLQDDIAHIGPWLFDALGVVRVYTESAAKRDDRPYTIRMGQTVIAAAELVHKDLATQFKFARLVRDGEPDHRVGKDFVSLDGDRIGTHT